MYADLRGIESHGVSNMMRLYVQWFREGDINPTPQPKILHEAAAVATMDSDRGHGLVIAPQAMNMAIERAEQYGVGAITVTNGQHFGAAAYHAGLALEHDMIGLAMTTGGLALVPVHGAKPMVGLNPLGVAAPAGREAPFIFDASMSSVAGNKIQLAQRLGVSILPGWISEKDGTPIMDEGPIPQEWMVLPLGGTREIGAHKGYSLAMMPRNPQQRARQQRRRAVPAQRSVPPLPGLQDQRLRRRGCVQAGHGRVSARPAGFADGAGP